MSTATNRAPPPTTATSCPLGTMAAELKNDEAFRPLLDAAFRRWERPIRAVTRRPAQPVVSNTYCAASC